MANKCAIVTGGGRNIGNAISRRLQADGYRVFVLDIVEPEHEALRADALKVDLLDPLATREAIGSIANSNPVNCLVNNVGLVAPAPLDEVKLDDFDRLMHLNLRTAIVCAQELLPGMRTLGGGRIVFNTSRVTKGKLDRTL